MTTSRIVPCPKCAALNRIPLAIPDKKAVSCGKCHEGIDTTSLVFNVNSSALFKIITNSPIPVVVDFWAPWCGPCKMFGPVFENYARNYPTSALCLKLNTEDNEEASNSFGIRSIPTLMIFENEKEKDRISGAMNLPDLKSWLNKNGVQT